MSSVRVLVVEDNDLDRVWIRRSIRASGSDFETTYVATLKEALACLSQTPFDAALVDLGLPDSSALHTVTTIASRYPHLAIVVFSGNDPDDFARAALRNGAHEYLLKAPENSRSIMRTLWQAIDRAQYAKRWSANSLRDVQTQLLSEAAFRLVAETYVSAAAAPAQLCLVRPSHLTADPHANHNQIERVVHSLAATFSEHDVIGRLDESTFAVLIKDGSQTGDSILRRLEENANCRDHEQRKDPLQFAIHIAACDAANSVDRILADATPLALRQTA